MLQGDAFTDKVWPASDWIEDVFPKQIKMAIEINEVRHIARLARLAISGDEAAGYAEDLSKILQLVDHMNACPTLGVEPLANPLDATQPLRADVVTETDQRARFQDGAPAAENGLYLVPKVIG